MAKILEVVQAIAYRYHFYLHAIALSIGTVFAWRLLKPSFERPGWIPTFISTEIYLLPPCMMLSKCMLDALQLIIEVVRTRPWMLALGFSIEQCQKKRGGRALDFAVIEVTPNLALALRYLRRTSSSRTLWIDALCINQDDKDDEKTTQIQRMDLIYANASPVVVWLGGYHRLGEEHTCVGASLLDCVDCEHQRRIAAAFRHLWTRSGWRIIFTWYFDRREENRLQEAPAGLCELVERGWWQRLWVIQEVALATGLVQIQCGHDILEYEEFDTGKRMMLVEFPEDRSLRDAVGPSDLFHTTTESCRYSSIHDRERPFLKLLVDGMDRFLKPSLTDPKDVRRNFHEQPFPQRLQRILLRTAGRFKCRDDRDRVLAVIGIAAGSQTGEINKIAGFMETLSSYSTRATVMNLGKDIWGGSWNELWVGPKRTNMWLGICLAVVWSSWGMFYDNFGRYWAINRPYFAVGDDRKELGALTNSPQGRLGREEFFLAIAKYLAEATGTLSFLDAVDCGGDNGGDLPSWVPTWSTEVSETAYEFAYQRKGRASDMFEFSANGKELTIYGRASFVSKTIERDDLVPGSFEIMHVLRNEDRRLVLTCLLVVIYLSSRTTRTPVLSGSDWELLSPGFRSITNVYNLRLVMIQCDMTAVICNRADAVPEFGFVTRGSAAEDDRLVLIPGTFHRLLLRKQQQMSSFPFTWKLVGLVKMAGKTSQVNSYSNAQWRQLLENGILARYIIN
jgi:hypothetical protein